MVIAAALLAVAAPAAAAREPGPAPQHPHVAEISGPTLSPDGRRVAFRVSQPSIEANRITLDWYVGDVDGDPPVHAASGGDARIDGAGLIADQTPIWDQDSRGFRFLALNEGEVTLWHWRDGQGAREEIRNEADLLDFAVSDDGELIRYTIGATRRMIADAQLAAYDEGVLVDASVDLNQAIAGGIIENGKRFMQRFSGPWFDRKPLLWDAPRRDIVVAADNSPQPAAAAEAFRPRQISAAQGASVTSADGSRADIERENGDTRLVVTRPDGRRTMCNAPTCGSPRLLAVAWRPGHDTLLLFVAEGSAREGVWLWRVGAARARKLAVTDGALRLADRPLRCAVSASALTCAESTPLVPPRLVSINLESGKRRATFEPNAALAARIDAEATPLELSGGYSAVLLRPQGAKVPPPVVVQNYHCAGFLKGGTGEELPMLPLAEHGIAVLCIDPFRGPPGSGTDGTYVHHRLHGAKLVEGMQRLAHRVFGVAVVLGEDVIVCGADNAGDRRVPREKLPLHEQAERAVAPPTGRYLIPAGFLPRLVENGSHIEAMEQPATRNIIGEGFDGNAGLDAPDIGLGKFQPVERDVARGAEGEFRCRFGHAISPRQAAGRLSPGPLSCHGNGLPLFLYRGGQPARHCPPCEGIRCARGQRHDGRLGQGAAASESGEESTTIEANEAETRLCE